MSSSPSFPLCRRRRPHPVAAPDGVRRAPSPRPDASRLVNRPHGRPSSLLPPLRADCAMASRAPAVLPRRGPRPASSPLALASPLHAGLRVALVADARGRPPPLPAGLTRLCPASSAHGARPHGAPVSPAPPCAPSPPPASLRPGSPCPPFPVGRGRAPAAPVRAGAQRPLTPKPLWPLVPMTWGPHGPRTFY